MQASWTNHVIAIEGKPAAIWTNTVFAAQAPVAALSDLVMCHIPVASARENGLPSEEAFEAIYAFEDRIMKLLPDGDDHVYVGRYADGLQAIFHFYTNQAAALIDTLEVDAKLADITRFACRQQTDPSWGIYFDILMPTDDEQNASENAMVRANLAKHGDDGTEPRQIDHYVYFDNRPSRKSFMAPLPSEGFVILEAPFFARDGKFVVIFNHLGRPIDIDPITLTLTRRAREAGGLYDGWECPVVRAAE